MKKITLTKATEGWMANFHGDNEILELFGTTTIPTSFTAKADAAKVLAEIRRLNPSHEVTVSA